jgi:hypothetical protein
MHRSIALVFLCIPLICSCPALAATLFSADFEGATVGSLPSPWKLSGTSPTTSAGVADGYADNATRVMGLHDTNTDTANNHLYVTFAQITANKCTLQFDACPSSNHAAFGARITNGGTVTSGASWMAAIVFEGDVPYAAGAAAGTISYQGYTSGTNAYTATNPRATYQGGVWYTVKIAANLDTKTYDLYFGPRGGTLALITPSAGVPFIKGTGGLQVTSAAGASFFSSQKAEPAGDLYIDNVTATTNLESPNTISEARTLPLGSVFPIQDAVVTAGTDQMTGPFFYIQDQTGGIRVRTNATVRQ